MQAVAFALGTLLVFLTVSYIGYTLSLVAGKGPSPEVGAPFFASYTANFLLVFAHAMTAIPPLILGLWTLHPEKRKNLKNHRTIGTIYCVCIWISSILGLMLATANRHGIIAQAGFGTLAVLWFGTTLFAYLEARKRRLVIHRRWMIRSYALTMAVITVRPMFFFPPEFMEYDDWYRLVTWICWLPNLLLAELYIRSTSHTGRWTGWKKA